MKDSEKEFYLNINNGNVLLKDTIIKNVNCIFITNKDILKRIFIGEINTFTAAGKSHVSDDAPLDWKIKGGYNPKNMKDIYFFIMHYFNVKKPEKIKLGEKYS